MREVYAHLARKSNKFFGGNLALFGGLMICGFFTMLPRACAANYLLYPIYPALDCDHDPGTPTQRIALKCGGTSLEFEISGRPRREIG